MIERAISEKIRISTMQVPVVTVLGPRQAGKTTLVKSLFPEYAYVNLEDRATRELAENDYIGFFSKYPEPMIIDEVQRVPELLSAILKVSRTNVVGADINELAPMLDPSGASTATACKVLRELILSINK